jgi:hypothetical protein
VSQPAAAQELPQPSAEIVCAPELCGSQSFGDIFEMKVLLLGLHDITWP